MRQIEIKIVYFKPTNKKYQNNKIKKMKQKMKNS